MLTSTDDFLAYFEGIHRRTLRDVLSLPAEAESWTPAEGDGEQGWGPGKLVGHIANTRNYFVRAYRGEGWIAGEEPEVSPRETWPEVIERSAAAVHAGLAGTPADWLQRGIQRLGSDEHLLGWQILMTMVEHEVHHRSQLDTYSGLNGWNPPQIYDRKWEQVLELQAAERRSADPPRD